MITVRISTTDSILNSRDIYSLLLPFSHQLNDFDIILNYASKYMKNLKHVRLKINDERECNTIHLTSSVLNSFLQTNKSKLDSFVWSLEDFCLECGRRKTNSGKVWLQLEGLKVLEMTFPIFSKSQDLVRVLKQQQKSLISLTLASMAIGTDMTTWSRNDCKLLATSISQCKHLVRLDLSDNKLRDSDVEILCRLPNLRVLALGTKPGEGQLTDKACKFISRSCPELQKLDIIYHRSITVKGIQRVLKNCRHLRMIHSSAKMKPQDITSLAPKLMFLGTETRFDTATSIAMVQATGGRVVHYAAADSGMLYVDSLSHMLSDEIVQKYHQTQKLLTQLGSDIEDPRIINEWDVLFDA